jgi:hypothetical protein
MSRRVRPFTQGDITTAFNGVTKGVVQSGVSVSRYDMEIAPDKIKISIFVGTPETAAPQNHDVNEWDSVK